MKRGTAALLNTAKKQKVCEKELPAIPEKYSHIDHMLKTPMAVQLMKGIQKKNCDISFLSKVADAATEEGSACFQTRLLARTTESKLHTRLKNDLPEITTHELPVQFRGKVVYRKVSSLSGCQQTSFGGGSYLRWGWLQTEKLTSGMILPSSYIRWLSGHPNLLKWFAYGTTEAHDRRQPMPQLPALKYQFVGTAQNQSCKSHTCNLLLGCCSEFPFAVNPL